MSFALMDWSPGIGSYSVVRREMADVAGGSARRAAGCSASDASLRFPDGSLLGETAAGDCTKVFDHVRTRPCVLFFDEFRRSGKSAGYARDRRSEAGR